jgi:hypothetical protein
LEEQYDLFADTDIDLFSEPPVPYLQVVYDGESRDFTMQELFDADRFQELQAVSFVASPAYFFKHTQKFEKISLILGIEENKVLDSFTAGLEKITQSQKGIDFWNDLDPDIQQQVADGKYEIRYANRGTPIHSKFYLLKGDKGSRVMIGSANFSHRAFEGKQFEELLVFDGPEMVALFEKRFRDLYAQTVDYIPERIKETVIAEQPILLLNNPELLTQIMTDEIAVSKDTLHVTEEVMEEILNASIKQQKELETVLEVQQIVEVVFKKNRKSNQYVMKTAGEITKNLPKLKAILKKSHKHSDESDVRTPLYFRDVNNQFYRPAPHTGEEAPEKVETVEKYNRLLTTVEIEKQLNVIERFVQAYEYFTENQDLEKKKRVYEMILYTLMSPFIWKIRDHYVLEQGRDAVRSQFEPFLIVGGRAYSGKSTALEFCNRLLGNENGIPSYKSIEKFMPDYLRSSNLSPVLVEEIPHNFFTSTAQNKGEILIKEIANEQKHHHPVMIGVTNTTDFDVNQQMARRIYYLQIDNAFKNDKETKEKAAKYLDELFNEVSDALFQDFLQRGALKIDQGEQFYEVGDMLYLARMIFKEYYALLKRPIPDFFPDAMFDDAKVRGSFTWQQLYVQYPSYFSEDKKENVIFVHNQMFRTERERTRRINMLPVQCIKEDSAGVLILNKEPFLNYIGMHHQGAFSFLSKWFRSKQKAPVG